jgi:hypothetical protein
LLNKLNTFLRLSVVLLLIYPLPIAMGAEVTVNEDFSDSTYQAGLTISGGSQDAYIYTGEQGSYNTTGPSLALRDGTYTFTFSSEIKVYEVGFMIGAVNNAYSVTWNYADSTSETENKSAQSTSNFDNMYDDFYKSFTDYNAVEENTDKFITSFAVTLTDISLLDTLYWQYDDSVSTGSFATTTTTTTTVLTSGIGDPANLTVSANLHSGSISIDWDAATGYQTNAERYAIAFSNDNFQSMNYAVATGNVGSANALNTEYTFTKTYLDSEFDAGDTIYFKVRADNDTNSQYSNWTAVASYVIQDVAAGPTNITISNTEYQGLDFTWTAPATGWGEPTSFMIDFSTEGAPYEVDPSVVTTVTGITATSHTIKNIDAGTYYMRVLACTQNGSNCHGQSNGSTTVTVNSNTSVTTTTTTTTIYVAPPPPPPPPPPAPEEIIVDVVIEGVDKTYTQADVNDGTTSRDQERADNELEFNCFMTDAQIARGDCEYEEDNYANDGYLVDPTDETDDMPIYDENKVKENSDIIEFDDEDEIYTDDETDVEDELFEGDDIILNPLSEEDFKVLYEDVFTEIQDLTFFANDGWSEDGTECFEEECIPLTEEQIEEQEAFFQEFVETYLEVDKFFEDNKDTYIVEEEQLFTEIPEDIVLIIEEEIIEEELPIEDEEVFEPIEEIIEEELPLPIEEDGVFGDLFKDEVEEVQLTEEEVEILVEETEEAIAEVVIIEIVEEEPIDIEGLTEEEVFEAEEKADEELTEKVEAAVAELPTEEKVKVVQAVAETKIQNLGTADKTTQKIVQAVVKEVTKVETVAELSEEEKTEVGQVLGFTEEEASEDLTIIAEQAASDENTAQALNEFVDRAIENQDVENFTLADVVTEVQVEAFLENPVGELLSVNIREMDLGSIGSDMTSDQKEKAQEVVVPIIIASQIISQAGALMTRRF